MTFLKLSSHKRFYSQIHKQNMQVLYILMFLYWYKVFLKLNILKHFWCSFHRFFLNTNIDSIHFSSACWNITDFLISSLQFHPKSCHHVIFNSIHFDEEFLLSSFHPLPKFQNNFYFSPNTSVVSLPFLILPIPCFLWHYCNYLFLWMRRIKRMYCIVLYCA